MVLLCTTGKALATGKNTKAFNVLRMRFEFAFSFDGVQIARDPDSRREIS